MKATDDPLSLRTGFRAGAMPRPTAGLATGYAQANIAIVPAAFVGEFAAFLEANPAACPLIARGTAGDPAMPELGADIDIRFDLPRYRVFREGRIEGEPTDISDVWRDDLVAFAIGCSLTFEADLLAGGVDLRCYTPGTTCSAFDTDLPLRRVGRFGGRLVVSMRAIRADQVSRAAEITRRHPESHGGPIHIGDPSEIGVDLNCPIDGIGLTDIRPGEVAVFWACGVSMERAIQSAAPDLAITHAPGHMLITDQRASPACADMPATRPREPAQ